MPSIVVKSAFPELMLFDFIPTFCTPVIKSPHVTLHSTCIGQNNAYFDAIAKGKKYSKINMKIVLIFKDNMKRGRNLKNSTLLSSGLENL